MQATRSKSPESPLYYGQSSVVRQQSHAGFTAKSVIILATLTYSTLSLRRVLLMINAVRTDDFLSTAVLRDVRHSDTRCH